MIHTHKEVSLARKHNVKDLLQSFLHGLCIKKHSSNSSFISNKFLFEEDLGDGVNKNVQKGRSYRKFQKLQSGGQRPPKSMQRYPQYQGQRYKNLRQEPDPDRTPRTKEGISWRSGSASDLGSEGPRFESPGLHGVSPLQPLNVKLFSLLVYIPFLHLKNYLIVLALQSTQRNLYLVLLIVLFLGFHLDSIKMEVLDN